MAAVFKDPRKRAHLNPDGADKPLTSPIPPATLVKARGYRKQRLVDQLRRHDCAAILLYDPVNIRYAFDVSNMQLWMTHNASHYAILCADGHGIDFEYRGAEHVAHGLETIDEVRSAVSWFYFTAGPGIRERVETWADEVADIVRQHGGTRSMRAWPSTRWSRRASTPCGPAASSSWKARSSPSTRARSSRRRSSSS